MSRREFHFSEGTANKFWAIEVAGKSQTVHFGKTGTSGQTQTKEFASEDEAKKASDKLIAEKVKKGYTEVSGETKSAGAPVATVKSEEPAAAPKKSKAKATPIAEPETKSGSGSRQTSDAYDGSLATSATVQQPSTAKVTRTIDLDLEDVQRAEWPRKWRPQPRPPVRPFDREQCIQAFLKAAIKNTYWNFNWPSVCIQPGLSPHEAQFWLLTLVEPEKAVAKSEAVAQRLAKFTLTGQVTYNEAFELLNGIGNAAAVAVLPLSVFLSPDEIVTLALHEWKDRWGRNHTGHQLVAGFAQFVLPYLDENDVARLQAQIRPQVNDSLWASSANPPPLSNLAAHMGLHEDLRTGLAAMDAGAPNPVVGTYVNVRFWVMSLGKPEWILAEGQRLKIRFTEPGEIRAWLASTRFAGLDIVRDSILEAESAYERSAGTYEHYSAKEQAERLTEELARVKAPEAAPIMLELKLASKGPAVARQWLDVEAGNAIAGLIPVAAGRGKLADAAVDYLRTAKKKGHEKLIRDCLKGASQEVAASIERNVLDYAEKEYAALDDSVLPPKLKAAFDVKVKKTKLPEWTAPENLPPILIDDKMLGVEKVRAVLDALQRSKLETCYFVEGLRGASGYMRKEKKITIGDVNPIAVSEVLTDISALAAKGK